MRFDIIYTSIGLLLVEALLMTWVTYGVTCFCALRSFFIGDKNACSKEAEQ